MNIYQFILLAGYTVVIYNVGHFRGWLSLKNRSKQCVEQSPELTRKIKALADEYKGKL